jgi:hypothetical protein
MNLELSDAERALLAEIVEGAYGDLREEIYKTETFDYKEQLKAREALLTGIRAKLQGGTNAPA